MRILSLLAVAASLAIAGPAFAQNMMNGDYSANDGSAPSGGAGMSNRTTMHRSYGHRQHALGSMRRPTVGHTANQRVNGG